MKWIVPFLSMVLVVGAAEYVEWPDGEPLPTRGPQTYVPYSAVNPDGSVTTGYNWDNLPPNGYIVQRDQPADGYTVTGETWVKSNNLAVVAITVRLTSEIEAEQAAAAEAAAAAALVTYSNKVVEWAESGVGLQVKLLRRELVALGFTPPWTFEGVKAGLLARVEANTLDAAGKAHMLTALALFNMLEQTQMSEDDIKAVREYLEANGGT